MKLVNENPLTACTKGQYVAFFDERSETLVEGHVAETCDSLESRSGIHVSTDKYDPHGRLVPIGLLFPSFDEACDALCGQDTKLGSYMRSTRNVPDLVRFALEHDVSNGFCTMEDGTARKAFKMMASRLLGMDFKDFE